MSMRCTAIMTSPSPSHGMMSPFRMAPARGTQLRAGTRMWELSRTKQRARRNDPTDVGRLRHLQATHNLLSDGLAHKCRRKQLQVRTCTSNVLSRFTHVGLTLYVRYARRPSTSACPSGMAEPSGPLSAPIGFESSATLLYRFAQCLWSGRCEKRTAQAPRSRP